MIKLSKVFEMLRSSKPSDELVHLSIIDRYQFVLEQTAILINNINDTNSWRITYMFTEMTSCWRVKITTGLFTLWPQLATTLLLALGMVLLKYFALCLKQFDSVRTTHPSTQVWEPVTLKCMKTLSGHNGSVLALASDSSLIYSGSQDKLVKVMAFTPADGNRNYSFSLRILKTDMGPWNVECDAYLGWP